MILNRVAAISEAIGRLTVLTDQARAQAGANGKIAENESAYGKMELRQSIATWQESSAALRKSMDNLFEVLGKQQDHFPGAGKMAPDQFPEATKLIGASGGKGPRS